MKLFTITAALLVGVAAFAQVPLPDGAVPLSGKSAVSVRLDSAETVVTSYVLKGRKWKTGLVVSMIKEAAYDSPVSRMTDSVSVIDVNGAKWIHFAYLNTYDSVSEADLVHVLYNPLTSDNIGSVFTGRLLRQPDGFAIEGWSDLEIMEENSDVYSDNRLPLDLLKDIVGSDSRLRTVPRSRLLDETILEWWHVNNAGAVSGKRSRLSIGSVDSESGIHAAFESAAKQKSLRYIAAVFDHMGQTLLVAGDLGSSDYALAWAEPACLRKDGSRYLYNWYFENDTTVSLVFVENKKLKKYHISLASHSLKITY